MGETRSAGWWDQLVVKFRDLSDEPTSRKTVILMEVSLAAQFGLSLIVALISRGRLKVADESELVWWLLAAIATQLMCLLAAWRPASQRREARWTAYLVVASYGTWLGAFVIANGNSVVMAWALMIVILVAVWYDLAIGVLAAAFGLVLLLGGFLLTAKGLIPYASLTDGRPVDWSIHTTDGAIQMIGAIGAFLYAFGLVCLAAAARAAQKRDLEAAHTLISRYAPTQVVAELAGGTGVTLAAPRRVKLTIVFSDIVGFTDATDELDPEELSTVLNEYLSEMATIAHAHDGTVEQFVGDAVMVFFGAPVATSDEDHAIRAVRMSLAMQDRLIGLQQDWALRGIRMPFQSRIGVNTGHASVGDFGSEDRSVYGAVGLQVNIAARIQAQCTPGTVLVSETTHSLVRRDFDCAPKGELSLKGVHFPVRVFEVSPTSAGSP